MKFLLTAVPLLVGTIAFADRVIAMIERWLTPVFDLAIRLYVAEVFFRSGMLKITRWDSTLYLFENEYHVPLLPPHVAAVTSTAGELTLSTLLALGIAGRFGAAGLSAINLVAVISYSDLSDPGRMDHLLWGLLLMVTLLHGPGKLSVDHWIKH